MVKRHPPISLLHVRISIVFDVCCYLHNLGLYRGLSPEAEPLNCGRGLRSTNGNAEPDHKIVPWCQLRWGSDYGLQINLCPMSAEDYAHAVDTHVTARALKVLPRVRIPAMAIHGLKE